MKNNLVKTVIVLITLTMFSGAGIAQSQEQSQESNSSVEAGISNNIGPTTNNYYEAEEDTRGIDSPIQSSNKVHYSGEYDVNTVPDVSAPGLTTTLTETCMGSTSAGGAVVGFGFSFGTTWRDSSCVRRLDARQVQSLGYNLAAKEMMCDSTKVREAMQRAGKPCFADLPEAVRAEINPEANARVLNTEANDAVRAE